MPKKGNIPWNKGKKMIYSDETRARLSAIRKGNKHVLGKHWKNSDEFKEKCRVRMLGNKVANGNKNRLGTKQSEAMKLKISGSRNHFWKGGITPLVNQIRNRLRSIQWCQLVYKRDDYTCQFCLARSGNGHRVNLEADHIKPLSWIMEDENIKTFEDALNCKLIWDIDNGRTLCIDCHEKTDTFGSKALKRSVQIKTL